MLGFLGILFASFVVFLIAVWLARDDVEITRSVVGNDTFSGEVGM